MLSKAVLALCLITMTTTWASPKETGEFSYGYGENLGRIEVVKAEYGEDPLATIRTVLTDPKTDAGHYRRAAAATAFLGVDGLKLLLEQLKPMLAAQRYDAKTEACLRTVKYIQDPQCVEISLAVLESASAPVSFKVMAADNLTPLINRSRAGSGWRIVHNANGSSSTVRTVSVNSREPAYSQGKPVDKTCLLLAKQRIGHALSSLADAEENRSISETLESVMQTIDIKFEEAKNDSPLPDSKQSAEVRLKSLGERVGKLKILSDGRVVSLYRHRETTMRSKAEVGPREPEGEWRLDTYQFTIAGADGKSTEVVFQPVLDYAVVKLSHFSYDVRLLDARSDGGVVTFLYTTNGTIACESFVRSSDGVWSGVDSSLVPYGEIRDRDRVVVKGQILDNRVVQLDYKNGDMEKWQFEAGCGHIPTMIDHNDLKVTFRPLSEIPVGGRKTAN